MQQDRKPAAQHIADPAAAEPFALQVEEGQFIQCIERPQAGIELQAVDDRKWRGQPDVFGSEIAVPIDYETMTDSIREQFATFPNKAALSIEDALHCTPIQVEGLVEQDVPVENGGLFQ
jgi:hypothetical protein